MTVVSLHNNPVMTPSDPPNEKLVESLEWLLEAAKSGEIQGMASSYIFRDRTCGCRITGQVSYSMIGRMHGLMNDIQASLSQ